MIKPISMDKQYKTRDGRSVRILCVDREDSSFPVVALVSGSKGGQGVISYPSNGTYGEESYYDLIEVTPWDFPIDTPVLVRDQDGESWIKRHFAGVSKKGYPTTFCGGCTSFTADECSGTVSWNQFIKADV